jgi:hypothetical protein
MCTATLPRTKDRTNHCDTSNRCFLSETNHLKLNVKLKLLCQWRQVYRSCSYLVTAVSKHSFFKFCNFCMKNQLSGHFHYVAPLKSSNLLHNFFYVFDTEYTQDLGNRDEALPNLVCA